MKEEIKVLVVGTSQLLKTIVAKSLRLCSNARYTLTIRETATYPLEVTETEDNEQYDAHFIIFTIDQSSVYSSTAIQNSLDSTDVRYFLGRSCLVVGEAPKHSAAGFATVDLQPLNSLYELPLVFCKQTMDESNTFPLGTHLVSQIEMICRQNPTCDPFLVRSLDSYFIPSTVFNANTEPAV
eukprot:GFYU01028549.1.p1 GENE.GFYU01028549.1~~GFYU01028549.1.p1  ORF type:complete len:182 (-),score=30.41 GFYU01028549.1:135-680(-)